MTFLIFSLMSVRRIRAEKNTLFHHLYLTLMILNTCLFSSLTYLSSIPSKSNASQPFCFINPFYNLPIIMHNLLISCSLAFSLNYPAVLLSTFLAHSLSRPPSVYRESISDYLRSYGLPYPRFIDRNNRLLSHLSYISYFMNNLYIILKK